MPHKMGSTTSKSTKRQLCTPPKILALNTDIITHKPPRAKTTLTTARHA